MPGAALANFCTPATKPISAWWILEYCEHDAETQAICLYIEGLRDGRRFLDVARRIAPHKPIVVFKSGVTADGSRAAASHTAALAGSATMYRDLFRQAGLVQALPSSSV